MAEFMGGLIFIFAIIALGIYVLVHGKSEAKKALVADERLVNAKIFHRLIMTPVAISEEGWIGIGHYFNGHMPDIIHIKDITGFELIVNDKNVPNIGGAIVGGLCFGGVGALIGSTPKKEVVNAKLLLKLDDFHHPTREVPLLHNGGSIDNPEIRELFSTLEFVEKKYKESIK